VPEQKFGEIEGYSQGSTFSDRMEIKNAGLHKYHINGISRVLGEGCDSIVLNGGYIDDEDEGDWIKYTGEGGREEGASNQQYDQPFERGNLDLSRNKYSGAPIRVIRGANQDGEYAPNSGYRYDGLYYLKDFYPDIGIDGYRIFRYCLVKEENTDLPPSNNEEQQTRRGNRNINQIIRNPQIPSRLKNLYDYTCQVCGIRLESNHVPYAIGAHIKGLGRLHNGPDMIENMLVLCPNDHYLFDSFAFSINDDYSFRGKEGSLIVKNTHQIGSEFLEYHRDKYLIASQ
jgi:putative restriction endonuclease